MRILDCILIWHTGTHQFPLEKFQEAFDMVADFAGGSVKVSLLPNGSS
jgi:hypothetical protein